MRAKESFGAERVRNEKLRNWVRGIMVIIRSQVCEEEAVTE